jgi:DNA-binding MarR family transcriptional regulator
MFVKKAQTPLGSPIEQFTRMMFTGIITALARSLREEDFSLAQIAALHLLDQQGSWRVTVLADALGLSPSAGSRLADGLVQRGLVARAEDPDDRRAKTLVLTAKGRGFVDRASEDRVRVVLETAGGLPAQISDAVLAAVNQFRRR